jgi:hypothetical protein
MDMPATNPPRKENEGKRLDDEDFFVKVDNPMSYRRNLLEASKSTLGILRELYAVKAIREKKQEVLLALQKETKELRILVQKLDEMLPQYSKVELLKRFPDLKGADKKPKPEEQKPAPKVEAKKEEKKDEPKKERPVQKKLSDLEKLNLAMQNIDQKMSSLPKESAKKEARREERKDEPKKEKPATTDDLSAALDALQKKLKNI